MMKPIVLSSGNRLDVNCPADIGKMNADRTKVRQSLLNLVGNGLKFTPAGGREPECGVRADRDGAGWLSFVEAHDTGIGMTPEQISRLFQVFSQADPKTSVRNSAAPDWVWPSAAGSAASSGRRHHRLQRAGQRVGFHNQPAAPHENARKAISRSLKNLRYRCLETPAGGDIVLVVDDDPIARDLMRRGRCRLTGIRSCCLGRRRRMPSPGTSNPADGRHALDLMMPRMDGWAVLAAMKADPGLKDIPVVVVTIFWTKRPRSGAPSPPAPKRHVSEQAARPGIAQRTIGQVPAAKARQEIPARSWSLKTSRIHADHAIGHIRLAQARLARRRGRRRTYRTLEPRRRANAVRVIVLDLMMPDIDGFDFVTEFQKSGGWKRERCADCRADGHQH